MWLFGRPSRLRIGHKRASFAPYWQPVRALLRGNLVRITIACADTVAETARQIEGAGRTLLLLFYHPAPVRGTTYVGGTLLVVPTIGTCTNRAQRFIFVASRYSLFLSNGRPVPPLKFGNREKEVYDRRRLCSVVLATDSATGIESLQLTPCRQTMSQRSVFHESGICGVAHRGYGVVPS